MSRFFQPNKKETEKYKHSRPGVGKYNPDTVTIPSGKIEGFQPRDIDDNPADFYVGNQEPIQLIPNNYTFKPFHISNISAVISGVNNAGDPHANVDVGPNELFTVLFWYLGKAEVENLSDLSDPRDPDNRSLDTRLHNVSKALAAASAMVRFQKFGENKAPAGVKSV